MEYKDVYLISEDRLKDLSLIDNNLSPKYIYPMVKVAQDTILKNTIGKNLLKRIKEEVINEDISEDIQFILSNFIEDILIWSILDLIQVPLTAKIRNLGVMQNNSEQQSQMMLEDLKYNKNFYANITSSYIKNLTEYILDNHKKYPEYFNSPCDKKNNLNYNTGMVL